MPIHRDVFFVDVSLDTAIIAVKRIYKCSINEISQMFFDGIDYTGLIYWFDDAQKYIKEIQKSGGALQ